MSEESPGENMGKGRGIIRGFKTVGMGLTGDSEHPDVTGKNPTRRGPGRPPSGEKSFTIVGRDASQEGGKPPA